MKRAIQPFGNSVVRLRLLSESDLDMTMAWRNRDDVRIWFKNSQVITHDQNRAWYARYSERDDDFTFIVEAQGQPVGLAAVYGIDPANATAEVGRFMLAAKARGRGYFELACRQLLRFCAETLHLKSVFLEVKEENERAIRVYARNGFREVANAGGFLRMTCSFSEAAAPYPWGASAAG
ncbi:MAG: GNAT family N-acetyltransferase [Acidobacteriia bacterium]|nr:GNAT family N-acetyltransferase [Terriglobia bacterium]